MRLLRLFVANKFCLMAPRSTLPAPRCYLVTGAAGFIGSKVAEQLLAAGHTVVGVDNLNDYYDVRLKDYRLRKLRGAGRRCTALTTTACLG